MRKTIWKDVPGVMNADPRYFENASLLNQIYREAIELAFMAQRSFTQNTAAAPKKRKFFVWQNYKLPFANGN
jgi:aspartokinase